MPTFSPREDMYCPFSPAGPVSVSVNAAGTPPLLAAPTPVSFPPAIWKTRIPGPATPP